MGQGPIQAVENALSDAIHHTRNAIAAAIEKTKADAEHEKALIAQDVTTAVQAALATAKADAPEVDAAVKAAAKAVADAAIAALRAHGL